MRSILRFVFVGIPTAVLATGVVVAVSGDDKVTSAIADGDLQQDLKLASTSSIEFAPAGQAMATISAIEAPPSATPERSVRPKRRATGSRAVRPRPAVVQAAPEVAEAVDESTTAEASELETPAAEAAPEAPLDGGVALPRPTGIPVSFPNGGGYDPGPGTVIRGGTVDGDHCQIHGGRNRPVYGQPIYGRPRGTRVTLGDRVRAAQPARESGGRSSLGDRVRTAQGRSSDASSSSRGRGSMGDRVRVARGGR